MLRLKLTTVFGLIKLIKFARLTGPHPRLATYYYKMTSHILQLDLGMKEKLLLLVLYHSHPLEICHYKTLKMQS